MDLQTERRLEQFLDLSDLPVTRIEPRIEFSMPPFRSYIEYIDGRVLFSMSLAITSARRNEVLMHLLGQCHPARLQGIPLRTYVLRDRQVITCTPAAGSDVKHWVACWTAMLRLLEKLEKFAEDRR